MNDKELSRKIEERLYLDHFIQAYEYVTEELLEIIEERESPDFVCKRQDGTLIGVELTIIMREPENEFYETTILKKEFIYIYDLIDKAYFLAKKKAEKKQKDKWPLNNNTILILLISECPVYELQYYIDETNYEEFSLLGFSEIWLADFTEFSSYGDVELFGLFSKKWCGYHPRPH
ncbi:MAG: hypothetical protein Q7O12_00355 [Deltaproteobacteria bacterium]|nr:hypothetical protein [Deltaproteobacteria bacterium]